MAVVKNLLVRIGVNASGANQQLDGFRKRIKSTGDAAREAAAESRAGLETVVSAMAQGGKNDRIVSIASQIRELEAGLKAAEAAGFGYGYEAFENDARLLRELKAEYKAYVDEVNTDPPNPDDEPMKKQISLIQRLRNLWGNIRGTAGQVRNIGHRARESNVDISKMVASIRRIGVVSLGIRLVGSLMGRLRSIVSGYLSENEQLQAQVNGLKSAMGEALAPAINLVVNALSVAMPYVVGFANAVGELFSTLFGNGWARYANGAKAAAKATGGAASAQKELNRQLLGFDKITRIDGSSGSSGGGGGAGTSAAAIAGVTPAWLTNFKQTFTDLFNSPEFQSANIGGKIGQALQTGIDWIGDKGMTFNWTGAGRTLRENLESFFNSDVVPRFFHTVGVGLGGISQVIAGLLTPEFEELTRRYKEGGSKSATGYVMGLLLMTPARIVQWIWNDWLMAALDGLRDLWKKAGEEDGSAWVQSISNWFSRLKLPRLTITMEPVANLGQIGQGIANLFGFNALPRFGVEWFAKGAILDGAQIFGAAGNRFLGGGEVGREAVLPLDSNTGWMDRIADRVAARVGGGAWTVNVPVELDGKVITTVVAKNLRQQERANG